MTTRSGCGCGGWRTVVGDPGDRAQEAWSLSGLEAGRETGRTGAELWGQVRPVDGQQRAGGVALGLMREPEPGWERALTALRSRVTCSAGREGNSPIFGSV